jgi:hypothetical protein
MKLYGLSSQPQALTALTPKNSPPPRSDAVQSDYHNRCGNYLEEKIVVPTGNHIRSFKSVPRHYTDTITMKYNIL